MLRNFAKTLCSLYAKQAFADIKPVLSETVKHEGVGYAVVRRLYSTREDGSNEPTEESRRVKVSREVAAQEKLKEMAVHPNIQQKLKMIELEIELARSEGACIPQEVKASQMIELLDANSISHRRRLLKYFWQHEIHQKRVKRRKEMHKVKEMDRLEEINTDSALSYGLGHNSMFLRIYNKTINNYYNSRVFNALLYGSSIVFDCAYSEEMSKMEIQNCVKQLTLCIATNRTHKEPFYVSLTAMQERDKMFELLKRQIPVVGEDDFPVTITPGPPTSLYDRNRLVYLSPHSRNVLQVYNPNDVYIIGALVDKVSRKAHSLIRARELGVRHARLPLELVDWAEVSSTSLTLNQTLDILLDQNLTRDWMQSLQHVPRRKLKRARDMSEKRKLASANARFYQNLGRSNDLHEMDDDHEDERTNHSWKEQQH